MWNDEITLAGAIDRSADRPTQRGILGKVLTIDYADIEPQARGFSLERPRSVERVREIGASFLDGYHAALETREIGRLCERLELGRNEQKGFAYEGAGMAVAILDFCQPWRRKRLPEFLRSAGGDRFLYMLYVGAGWACSRLPVSPERAARRGGSLSSWLILDGYGFHEGFFHHDKYLGSSRRPKRLSDGAARIFDQGLGRSLWFIFGGDAELIARAIGDLAPDRHSDLWSGVGLAASYAGGSERENIERLLGLGERFAGELAQGAAFGAKARLRGGNLGEHTSMACEILAGTTAEDAAVVTDSVLAAIDQSSGAESFEAWRRGIIQHYTN